MSHKEFSGQEEEEVTLFGKNAKGPSFLELGPEMGSGSYGRVCQAKWKGASVAVKILGHEGQGTKTRQQVSDEVAIARQAVHPNVVTVYDVVSKRIKPQLGCPDTTRWETFLIMERADCGSLKDRLEKLAELRKTDRKRALLTVVRCLLDVVYGMEYLHSLGITHGDLKPANILCKSSSSDPRGYVCKLCDFGYASSFLTLEAMHSGENGTPLYASPERLRGECLSPANDVYSFGILAWQLLSNDDSQAFMPPLQQIHQVLQNDWRPDLPPDTPEEYMKMVCSAWAKDPAERPSFRSIRGHLYVLQREFSGL